MRLELMNADLELFDGTGGGAGSQAASSDSGHQGETGGNAPAQGDAPAEAKKDSDAGSQQETAPKKTTAERQKEYRAMVHGEYKDLYTQDTQRIISERFRETKAVQEQIDRQQPILDALFVRYGVEDGDVEKLAKAFESDDEYWRQAAEKEGLSLEQYKRFQGLQRKNEQFQRMVRQQQNQDAAREQFQKWDAQAMELRAEYPDFDLAAECKNPNFMQMLRTGIPVKFAYQVTHLEEIKSNAAKQTEKQVVDNIKAKGARPQENGTTSQSGVAVSKDVSKLSRKERAEMAKRAARGETISF